MLQAPVSAVAWLILFLDHAVRWIGVLELAEQRGVAVGALDHVVRRAVRQQPALARAEVDRLGVVGNQRECGLLGDRGVAVD